MPSRVDDVESGLVALSRTAVGTTVPVYDGPPVTEASDVKLILVGHDGDPESDAAATFEQEWADLAASSRYERGSIPCAAIAQAGDTDIAARRDEVFALVAAIEAAVRADLSLGGLVLSMEMVSGRAQLLQNARGAAVVVPFTVTYLAQV